MTTTTTTESPPAAAKVSEPTPVRPSASSAPRLSVAMGRVYEERFLGMPVAAVLVTMWLAGAAIMGSCALLLYLAVSELI